MHSFGESSLRGTSERAAHTIPSEQGPQPRPVLGLTIGGAASDARPITFFAIDEVNARVPPKSAVRPSMRNNVPRWKAAMAAMIGIKARSRGRSGWAQGPAARVPRGKALHFCRRNWQAFTRRAAFIA